MKRTGKNFGCKILTKKAKFKDILPKSSNTNSDEEDNVKVSTTTTNNPDNVIDEMSRFSEYVEEEEDSHGFKAPALVIGINVTRPPIVKASLPTAAEIMEDTESTNKKCIICLKSNLTMKALKDHVISTHNTLISEPLPAWLHAEKAWDNFLLTHPDYNSENEDCSTNSINPNATAKRSSKLSKKALRKKCANRSGSAGGVTSLESKVTSLQTLHEVSLADNSLNTSRILELTEVQDRNIASSTINTASI